LESKTKECVVVDLRWPLLGPGQNSQARKEKYPYARLASNAARFSRRPQNY
jgi:hypothetical protein